jgi:hypothetical protein
VVSHHRVGFGEGLVDGADIELALEAQIVARLAWIGGVAGSSAVSGSTTAGSSSPGDVDQLDGVSTSARARDHGADGSALPAGALDRDRRLRRRLQPLEMREHADPQRHHLGEFGAGDDRDHARRLLGRLGGDGDDAAWAWANARRRHAPCAAA